MVQLQSVYITIILYCAQIQYKVRTLYDCQPWYSCKVSILQCYYIVLKYNIKYLLYTTISHGIVTKCVYYNNTILCSNTI